MKIGLNTCIRWCLQSLGSIELEVAQEFDLFFFGKNYYNNIKKQWFNAFSSFCKNWRKWEKSEKKTLNSYLEKMYECCR